MKKIAILTCLKANEVCAGVSCLKAFNTRTRKFSRYCDQDVELAAFMRCNGCSSDPIKDPGLQEKILRLCSEQVEVVHVGVCTRLADGSRCPHMEKILEILKENGMEIVDGTH